MAQFDSNNKSSNSRPRGSPSRRRRGIRRASKSRHVTRSSGLEIQLQVRSAVSALRQRSSRRPHVQRDYCVRRPHEPRGR